MNQHTPTELQRMFIALPRDVKDAIFSLDVSERINVVGKRTGLTVEQLGELGSEVGLVLLGATGVSEFVNNLAERLKISKISAAKLAEYINGEIFSPIRESLKQVHGVEDLRFSAGKEMEEQIPPPPPLQPLKNVVPLPGEENKNLPTKPEAKSDDLLVQKEEEMIPSIFKGVVAPNAFEAKTDQQIFRNPPQKTTYTQPNATEVKYPNGVDPYREPPM